jgi:hypothetical protein
VADQTDRDALAEVLAAHATVATGLGEWCCKCDPTTWRPSAHRARHLADAASDWLAQRDRRMQAKAWTEGHAAGREYQGDGWNQDAHDPEDDNPYRIEAGDQ